jgi:RNA polymerase sigma factor (sigma-70 family)
MTRASSASLSLQSADTQKVRQALKDQAVEFREVLVLREWEGLSYKQIADVVDIPIGTVMSRLARARKRLQDSLANRGNKETSGELAVGAI